MVVAELLYPNLARLDCLLGTSVLVYHFDASIDSPSHVIGHTLKKLQHHSFQLLVEISITTRGARVVQVTRRDGRNGGRGR